MLKTVVKNEKKSLKRARIPQIRIATELGRRYLFDLGGRGRISGCSAVWLAHLVWDQGVEGSNPFTPTFK